MLDFQFKLIVDGILDLVLLPVSLVVGLISLIGPGPGWGSEFYEFLRTGRRGGSTCLGSSNESMDPHRMQMLSNQRDRSKPD